MEDTTTNELEQLDYPEDEKLFKIAYWSKAVSWVIVIVGVIKTFFDIARFYFSPMFPEPDGDIWLLGSMLTPNIGYLIDIAVSFFILQAVGEILYLVIDIKEQMNARGA